MRHLAALAGALLLAGAAAGTHVGWTGTTSTGDVDSYDGYQLLCLAAPLTRTTVQLELLDPAPGDKVLLVVWEWYGLNLAGAALASYEHPTVRASGHSFAGCADVEVFVAGLVVEGERPYRYSYVHP